MDTTATDEEMLAHVSTAEQNRTDQEEIGVGNLPWSSEEELLVVRPLHVKQAAAGTFISTARNALLFTSMVVIAYGLLRSPWAHTSPSKGFSPEKYLV